MPSTAVASPDFALIYTLLAAELAGDAGPLSVVLGRIDAHLAPIDCKALESMLGNLLLNLQAEQKTLTEIEDAGRSCHALVDIEMAAKGGGSDEGGGACNGAYAI